MPLTSAEIFVGSIAYFDDITLAAANLQATGTMIDRPGPLICYKTDPVNNSSYWTPLTLEYRPERFRIDKNCINNKDGYFLENDIYLQDGANSYCGNDTHFIHAASGQDSKTPATRPSVVVPSLTEIIATVIARGGL